MAQIESVKTATQANADMDDGVLNPDISNARAVVHITLISDQGTTVLNPDNIFDMVDAQFGTVTTDKVNARGAYIFRVS
jgi:hypothetical protein